MSRYRILVDPEIPGALDAFRALGDVCPFDAATLAVDPRQAADADVIVFRTTTIINERLLAAAPRLRALVTPVIGLNHVDQAAVRAFGAKRGHDLPVLNAPGSTAGGVADWVLAALTEAGAFDRLPVLPPTVAIVGLGHCGRALARRLDRIGVPWRACDPPRQAAGDPGDWISLDAIADYEVVTLHVPLTGAGESHWPTRDMFDTARLAKLAAGQTRFLVNASRGDVLVEDALLAAHRPGQLPALLLDVFRDEPAPDPALVSAARIATPHVAGSVHEGRHRAIVSVRDLLAKLLGLDVQPLPAQQVPTVAPLPDAPTRIHLNHMFAPVGIATLSDGFTNAYAAASPEDRPSVFRRFRSGSMRHEIGWPFPL